MSDQAAGWPHWGERTGVLHSHYLAWGRHRGNNRKRQFDEDDELCVFLGEMVYTTTCGYVNMYMRIYFVSYTVSAYHSVNLQCFQ